MPLRERRLQSQVGGEAVCDVIELPPPPMELTLRASTKIKTMISASQRQLEEEMDESVGVRVDGHSRVLIPARSR